MSMLYQAVRSSPRRGLLAFALACATVLLSLATSLALAQEVAPDVLVKSVSDEVLAAIRADRELQAGKPQKIRALVEAKVLPHVDFRRATQVAMGSNWRHASPEQQERLTQEFRTLLVRTYSSALAGYRDQVFEYRPLRAKPEETEVTVRSLVRQAGTEPVAIEYDLEKTPEGWKMFDIRVAGISLVATYRTSFAEEVRSRGVDGLIGLLSAKNRS